MPLPSWPCRDQTRFWARCLFGKMKIEVKTWDLSQLLKSFIKDSEQDAHVVLGGSVISELLVRMRLHQLDREQRLLNDLAHQNLVPLIRVLQLGHLLDVLVLHNVAAFDNHLIRNMAVHIVKVLEVAPLRQT